MVELFERLVSDPTFIVTPKIFSSLLNRAIYAHDKSFVDLAIAHVRHKSLLKLFPWQLSRVDCWAWAGQLGELSWVDPRLWKACVLPCFPGDHWVAESAFAERSGLVFRHLFAQHDGIVAMGSPRKVSFAATKNRYDSVPWASSVCTLRWQQTGWWTTFILTLRE